MISRRCPKAHSASTTPVALHAPGGGLTALPSSVGELTSLRRIDLDGNALTVLPAAVAALPRLEILMLYGNRLDSIPPEPVSPGCPDREADPPRPS
ncbi:leucine-rich repeat domain-containing protein [Microtetraspora malaysiensis]|uniref:leucine-rich repeat domain-containing protein n=1 Tax=Microtetraspora malaysiensis TaxID=161358 RepID=UPI003D8D9643